MQEVIAGVSPATALAVGLKVDVEALPRHIVDARRAGQVDLTSSAVTVEIAAAERRGRGEGHRQPLRPAHKGGRDVRAVSLVD